jgi:hypothetical protein
VSRSSASKITERQQKIMVDLAWCNDCKQYLPTGNFWPLPNMENFGFRYYCNDCEDKRRDKEKLSRRAKERNYALKGHWVNLMGGKCQRCKSGEFYASLDFHHIDPKTKRCNPSTRIYSHDELWAKEEIDKCCLLCRNCHAGYGAGGWQGEFIKAKLGYELKNHWLVEPPKKVAIYQAPPLFDLRNLTLC